MLCMWIYGADAMRTGSIITRRSDHQPGYHRQTPIWTPFRKRSGDRGGRCRSGCGDRGATAARRGQFTVPTKARSHPATMTVPASVGIGGYDPAPSDDGKASSPTIWAGYGDRGGEMSLPPLFRSFPAVRFCKTACKTRPSGSFPQSFTMA